MGGRAFAGVPGVSMIPMDVLMRACPLFAGIMFDRVGDYMIPFSVLAVTSFVGSTMFLLLGKPALKAG